MGELLVHAVLLDEKSLVRTLLDVGADPNERSGPLGRTALQLAARNDRPEIAATLLERGADPDAASLDRLTALHVAAANRSAEMVRLLLERGARPDPPARFNGKSPLCIAVERESLEVAELLLQRGASVRAAIVGSYTLLHLAARLESLDIAKAIFKYAEHEELAAIINARENIEGKTAFHMAVEREDLELCWLLLKHGALADEPCSRGPDAWYPLTFAVERQNERLTSLLLQHGARATADDCLRHSLRYRYRRLAQLLLRSGAASADGLEALQVAVDGGHADLVELCLKHGATPGPAILRRAVARGAAPIVELLLNAGATANQRLDKCGERPLDLAARACDVPVSRLLLKRGGALGEEASAKEQAFVVRLLALLEAEGVGMCPSNRRLVDGPWHDLLKRCRFEIKLMRDTKVAGAVTFYGLLTKEEDALAALARNDEFVAAFPKSNFREEFPQYADMLALNYARGRVRCKLLEKSAKELGGLMDGLPGECTYNVLRLLSNEELKASYNSLRTMSLLLLQTMNGDKHAAGAGIGVDVLFGAKEFPSLLEELVLRRLCWAAFSNRLPNSGIILFRLLYEHPDGET